MNCTWSDPVIEPMVEAPSVSVAETVVCTSLEDELGVSVLVAVISIRRSPLGMKRTWSDPVIEPMVEAPSVSGVEIVMHT